MSVSTTTTTIHFNRRQFLSITGGATADLRPGMVASAVVFQEMVKAAGITVEQVPGSNYWSEHWMQSALTVSNWSVFPSADTILSLAYHSTGVWNESGHHHRHQYGRYCLYGWHVAPTDGHLPVGGRIRRQHVYQSAGGYHSACPWDCQYVVLGLGLRHCGHSHAGQSAGRHL